MATFVLSLIIFTLAGLGLAVGLLGKRPKIRRACCQMSPSENEDSPCCQNERKQPTPREH